MRKLQMATFRSQHDPPVLTKNPQDIPNLITFHERENSSFASASYQVLPLLLRQIPHTNYNRFLLGSMSISPCCILKFVYRADGSEEGPAVRGRSCPRRPGGSRSHIPSDRNSSRAFMRRGVEDVDQAIFRNLCRRERAMESLDRFAIFSTESVNALRRRFHHAAVPQAGFKE